MQIAPKQIKAVDVEIVSKNQKRFVSFLAISIILGVMILLSFFVNNLTQFWSGNRLWGAGSFVVIVSVIHTRFFDIRKKSTPFNERVDPRTLTPWICYAEKIISHAWLLGAVLVGVSRWVHY